MPWRVTAGPGIVALNDALHPNRAHPRPVQATDHHLPIPDGLEAARVATAPVPPQPPPRWPLTYPLPVPFRYRERR